MSDADSFIEEVTEEVRRDRMFVLLRRWGWVGALAVVAIVGGAAYNEYQKAQSAATAQQLGDNIIAALAANDVEARAAALMQIEPGSDGGAAVLRMLTAAAQSGAGDTAAAVASLEVVAGNGELPEIYRTIAAFKALTLQGDTLAVADRRLQFEALAQPGAPLRLLALEQLALIDVETGEVDAALTRLQTIREDAEVTVDLQQRATQLMVALGADPAPLQQQQG